MTNKKQTLIRSANQQMTNESLIASGHRACAGCGQMISAIAATKGMGTNIIVANATGCLEVTTTPFPQSAWKMPWIHSVFENPATIASGIRAALDHKLKLNKKSHYKNTKVIAQGGDGGTFDIGFGLISGMWERRENILYLCYDTEAYSNTGIQASGATPWGSSTTTTPAGIGKTIDAIGSHQNKKDMVAIALAHGLKYVATSTAGFPEDITQKVKKAMAVNGPAYIQIMSPCVPGWKIKSDSAMEIGKLAVQTGLYPLLEYVDGKLVAKSKVPKKKVNVEEYLKIQGRFKHLFKTTKGKEQIKYIKKIADQNIEKYGLL